MAAVSDTNNLSLTKILSGLAVGTAIGMSLFHIYTGTFGLFTAFIQRGIHLTFALSLLFLTFPFLRKKETGLFSFINLSILAAALISGIYLLSSSNPAQMAARSVMGPSLIDLLAGGLVILMVLEGARRSCLPLSIIGLGFILYALFGGYLPGAIGHRGFTLSVIIEQLIFSTEGVYGLPLGVSATFVVLFIIFGAFLEVTGAGNFFVNLAYSIAGGTKSGPALTSVVASGFMGSISGSAVANVVTTGTFTIPLMKKVGYRPHFAGAVEAVASSGGQILPPIMGAGAFIMAEVMGVSYASVALAAVIPAMLYYISTGWMVHLEAERLGLKGIPRKELPDLKQTLIQGVHFLIPLIILVYLLVVVSYTPMKASIYAILATILVSFIRPESRMTFAKLMTALERGAKSSIEVAIACATAGIAIGVLTLTGMGLKISNLVIEVSQGNLLLALFLTMIACLILGMGLPTAAAYIITASLGAPALIELGVEPMAAHLFIFYFAIISAITPPVALAAYAGAGLAGAGAMQTAITASRLGIVAFIVPYMFVYGPSLVLVGSTFKIFLSLITALVGVFMLGCGVQGRMMVPANYFERAAMITGALFLIKPGLYTDGIGLAIVLITTFWMRRKALMQRTISQKNLAG